MRLNPDDHRANVTAGSLSLILYQFAGIFLKNISAAKPAVGTKPCNTAVSVTDTDANRKAAPKIFT